MNRRLLLAVPLGLCALRVGAAGAVFRPFRTGSFTELLARRAGQPFLLVLWSVTCVPCRQEFELLGELRQNHPGLPLVLVSTDDIADEGIVSRMVSRYRMEHEESWIFDGDAPRLRYEIDPTWYGELPRAYFYDRQHHREGVSGSLERERLEAWIRETGLG